MDEEVKLALIPPISLLNYATDYHLMLAQLTGNDVYSKQYDAFCQSEEDFVILDNGLAEGYEATDLEMCEKALAYEPDEVVIPDVMRQFQKNIQRCETFLDVWAANRPGFNGPPGLMFVVQGRNAWEFIASGIWAMSESAITTIGIPRHAVDTCNNMHARTYIANQLQSIRGFNKQIHFLGAAPSVPDEIKYLANSKYTNQRCVRGMDTSMPFNHAYFGCNVEGSVNIHRPPNYFGLSAVDFDPQAVRDNIRTMLEWAKG